MKLVFDVSRSLEECPPNKLYGEMTNIFYKDRQIILNHEKRIVAPRVKIDWTKLQVRDGVYDVNDVQNIKASYEEYSFIYSEQPQVVIRAPQGSTHEFWGLAGHNRDESQDLLGWETTIVDVVSFDSPLDQRIFSCRTNWQITPSAGMAEGDFIKTICDAIENGEIADNVVDVTALADAIIEPHRTAVKNAVIKKVLANLTFKTTLHRPLDGTLAKKLAKSLGIETGSKVLSYVKPNGESKTTFYDGMKSYFSSESPVTLYGYIEQPQPSILYNQRKAWLSQFEELKKFWSDIVKSATGKAPDPSKFPFIFGGFLPQNETPDPKKGGRPTEENLIFLNTSDVSNSDTPQLDV